MSSKETKLKEELAEAQMKLRTLLIHAMKELGTVHTTIGLLGLAPMPKTVIDAALLEDAGIILGGTPPSTSVPEIEIKETQPHETVFQNIRHQDGPVEDLFVMAGGSPRYPLPAIFTSLDELQRLGWPNIAPYSSVLAFPKLLLPVSGRLQCVSDLDAETFDTLCKTIYCDLSKDVAYYYDSVNNRYTPILPTNTVEYVEDLPRKANAGDHVVVIGTPAQKKTVYVYDRFSDHVDDMASISGMRWRVDYVLYVDAVDLRELKTVTTVMPTEEVVLSEVEAEPSMPGDALVKLLTKYFAPEVMQNGTGELAPGKCELKQYTDNLMFVRSDNLVCWPSGFYRDDGGERQLLVQLPDISIRVSNLHCPTLSDITINFRFPKPTPEIVVTAKQIAEAECFVVAHKLRAYLDMQMSHGTYVTGG